MQKKDCLYLRLKNPIDNHITISMLRAALTNLNNHLLIHHHINDTIVYKYPLVQYKLNRRQQPIITAYNEGIEEVLKMITHKEKDIYLQATAYHIEVEKITIKPFLIQVWDTVFYYHINNWLGLNSNNYQRYVELPNLTDRIDLLEKLLIAHILACCEGLGVHIEKKIVLKINHIKNETVLEYKQVLLKSFHVSFSTNISLPHCIGIGKATAVGFGTLYTHKKQQHSVNEK